MEVGRKRTCGFPWVSRHPVLMLAVEAPLCQIPLLSLQQQESCRQCLGHSDCWCQQSDPHRLWKSCEADRDKHLHGLLSVTRLRGRGAVTWHAYAAARAFQREAERLSAEGPDVILSHWRQPPTLPPELEKYPIWWKTCFCCTSSISCVWRGSAALGISPQPCPCQPPASLTATFGLG